jgi:threonylcarbamoyladenosine tRNA methylthiotransferase MtaB
VTTFSVEFLGCKVSQTDAQAMREALAEAGHVEAPLGDVHVVNGCSVTHEAVRKTGQAARRAHRAGARTVLVTGCAANLGALSSSALGPGIAVLPGRSEEMPAVVAGRLGATGCVGPPPGLDRTRAFVKVQDGCSFSCSFCVIPAVRGGSRSRTADAVLAEARRRAASGHRELVVTGVNLGLYRDPGSKARLPSLLRSLAEVEGVERIRLSSIEANHLTEDLADALADPVVCPHLHVPLQSGDDGVLRAMARRYDAAQYARRVERARARVPHLNLTGDVIVGFPAEDERAFGRTLAFVEELGFSRLHVFPYSPRPGTVTADADPVSPAVKAERSRRLRALSDRLAHEHRRRLVGRRDEVLVERKGGDGRLHGYGRDYTPFVVDATGTQAGEVVSVVGYAAGEHAVQAMAA